MFPLDVLFETTNAKEHDLCRLPLYNYYHAIFLPLNEAYAQEVGVISHTLFLAMLHPPETNEFPDQVSHEVMLENFYVVP